MCIHVISVCIKGPRLSNIHILGIQPVIIKGIFGMPSCGAIMQKHNFDATSIIRYIATVEYGWPHRE